MIKEQETIWEKVKQVRKFKYDPHCYYVVSIPQNINNINSHHWIFYSQKCYV